MRRKSARTMYRIVQKQKSGHRDLFCVGPTTKDSQNRCSPQRKSRCPHLLPQQSRLSLSFQIRQAPAISKQALSSSTSLASHVVVIDWGLSASSSGGSPTSISTSIRSTPPVDTTSIQRSRQRF